MFIFKLQWIRQLWELKTVVSLHWFLICAVLLLCFGSIMTMIAAFSTQRIVNLCWQILNPICSLSSWPAPCPNKPPILAFSAQTLSLLFSPKMFVARTSGSCRNYFIWSINNLLAWKWQVILIRTFMLVVKLLLIIVKGLLFFKSLKKGYVSPRK